MVIGWSVNSPNLRFSGVFHRSWFGGGSDDGGGVGTRGRGVAMGAFVGEGGGKDCPEVSLTYNPTLVHDHNQVDEKEAKGEIQIRCNREEMLCAISLEEYRSQTQFRKSLHLTR